MSRIDRSLGKQVQTLSSQMESRLRPIPRQSAGSDPFKWEYPDERLPLNDND